VNNGIVLGLFAYASFSWGDAAIKALGGQLGVFEIGFFSTLFAGLFIFFAKPGGERWRDFGRMKRPWAVQARALSGITAGVLGVYAFTTIPLAEAYALIFVAPFFVTLLSIFVLKEQVGLWRWLAIALGFIGVMLVVRPGFRDLHLGHLAALGVAFFAAFTIVILRSLAGQEKRTSLLGVLIAYGLIFNGIAAVPTFTVPNHWQLALLLFAGGFAAVGQVALIAATRRAPANQIAPTHYSQILWAVAIGAAFFDEYPDTLALVGLAVVGGAGLLTLARERIRLGNVRWNPFLRNRL
jgi:drug/metabolite transporter (DMT)-like permease